MKVKLKVVTEVEYEFPNIPPQMARQEAEYKIAASIEGGWRLGMEKDIAMAQAVMSHQFRIATPAVVLKDIFFDFQFPE